MVKGLESKTYEEHLRSLGLLILEKAGSDPITVYNFLEVGSKGEGADLLSLVSSNRTQGNGIKLHQGNFRLEITHLVGCWSLTQASPGKCSWH